MLLKLLFLHPPIIVIPIIRPVAIIFYLVVIYWYYKSFLLKIYYLFINFNLNIYAIVIYIEGRLIIQLEIIAGVGKLFNKSIPAFYKVSLKYNLFIKYNYLYIYSSKSLSQLDPFTKKLSAEKDIFNI